MNRILIAGDFVPQGRAAQLIAAGRSNQLFAPVKPLIEGADYSIVNLECVVADASCRPIRKAGACLKCTPDDVKALRQAGFRMVTLANNHFADYGTRGVELSLDAIRQAGLDYVGAGLNLTEASQTRFITLPDGSRCAFINCCEHEFSIATDTRAGCHPLNPVRQFRQIAQAKAQADYTIVIVHGGHEHFPLPSPRMQETYRFFIDAGADAVVGHHQHCPSGYEHYHDRPIVYGLGNFCFDRGADADSLPAGWHEGYMVELLLEQGRVDCRLHPYKQCREEAVIRPLNDRTAFDATIERLNAVITEPAQLKRAVEDYYDQCVGEALGIHEPWPNIVHVLRALLRLVRPDLLSHHRYAARNQVCCESHLDKLRHALLRLTPPEP